MPEPTTAELLAFALALADAADAVTLRHYRGGGTAWRKADASYVTLADTETESLLRSRIGDRYPGHSVLGEEEGETRAPMSLHAQPGAPPPPRWIVDPVDGTHNFVRGIPVWATLVACERGGRVEVGVASAPALGTRWWAGRGLGAYRGELRASGAGGGERIAVSRVARLEDAQVAYGSYRLTLDAWGGRADALLRGAWRQRGFGDFWGHCLVAEGAAEVMLEGEIAPWDIAAVQVIVEEAGGALTDVDGRARLDAGHCITTNGLLHAAVLRGLRGD